MILQEQVLDRLADFVKEWGRPSDFSEGQAAAFCKVIFGHKDANYEYEWSDIEDAFLALLVRKHGNERFPSIDKLHAALDRARAARIEAENSRRHDSSGYASLLAKEVDDAPYAFHIYRRLILWRFGMDSKPDPSIHDRELQALAQIRTVGVRATEAQNLDRVREVGEQVVSDLYALPDGPRPDGVCPSYLRNPEPDGGLYTVRVVAWELAAREWAKSRSTTAPVAD